MEQPALKRLATIAGHGPVSEMTLRCSYPNVSLATLWRAIIEPEQLKVWWPDWEVGGLFEPHPGGRVVIGDGAWLNGRITQWEPHSRLAYTWREDQPDATWFEANSQSAVLFLLEDLGQKHSQLTLQQPMPTDSVVGGTAGWHYFAAERLPRFLAHLPQLPEAGRFEALVELYGPEPE